MKIKGKKFLVYGLGESGRAVVDVLKRKGADVCFYDDNLEFANYIGFERDPFSKKYDCVVVSPGVNGNQNKLLEHFKNNGVRILSEIDFAYLLCKGKIIAITGTNGKTTTCLLTYKILKNSGFDAFLCGNIGLPFSAIAEKTTKNSIIVCEISSFQLELSSLFKPNIACILNLKPDHLDRHGSFDNYKKAKEKIAQNMKNENVLILNMDDEETKQMIVHKNFKFFTKKETKHGTNIVNQTICNGKKKILDIDKIKLKGEKNLENVLASVAICSHFKVKKEVFEKTIENFETASHRMEVVGDVKGATYVDDSKATNVASTLACLQAFKDRPIVLLLGGMGKDIEYDEIFESGFSIKCVVCFGMERKNISKCAEKHRQKFVVAKNLKLAVKESCLQAESGDVVLLSPACSSFDEFSSYKDRGDKFKEYVLELLNEE